MGEWVYIKSCQILYRFKITIVASVIYFITIGMLKSKHGPGDQR